MLRTSPSEVDHTPAYYKGYGVDFWFRLWDIRRLAMDGTRATIHELRRLRSVRYNGRPISLYGGTVEFPLIVTRDEEAKLFTGAELLTEGMLRAQREARFRSETERLSRELRANLFGRAVWDILDAATRTFVTAAEAAFRARRDDPHFDFSGRSLEYAKAVAR